MRFLLIQFYVQVHLSAERCGVIKADNPRRLVEHIQKLQYPQWKRKQHEAEELRPQKVLGRLATTMKLSFNLVIV